MTRLLLWPFLGLGCVAVFFHDHDVEHGLTMLLGGFNEPSSFEFEEAQREPLDLRAGASELRDIDRCARGMNRPTIASVSRRVAVLASELKLPCDRSHCRVDLERLTELLVEISRDVREEPRRPGTDEVPLIVETRVDDKGMAHRNGNDEPPLLHALERLVIRDVRQLRAFRLLVLDLKRFRRAA